MATLKDTQLAASLLALVVATVVVPASSAIAVVGVWEVATI